MILDVACHLAADKSLNFISKKPSAKYLKNYIIEYMKAIKLPILKMYCNLLKCKGRTLNFWKRVCMEYA